MDPLTTTSSSWKALLSSSLSSPLAANHKNSHTTKTPFDDDNDASLSSLLFFSKSCPTSERTLSESSPQGRQLTSPSSSLLLHKLHKATTTFSSSQSPSTRSSSSSRCGGGTTHDDRDDEDCHDPDLPTTTRTTPPILYHARLDGSLQCCQCHASHALYLMYPIVKTFETWNLQNQYLCALCHHHDHNDNNDNDDHDNDVDEQGRRRVHVQVQEDPLHISGPSTPLWAHTNSHRRKSHDDDKQQEQHPSLFLSSSSSVALPSYGGGGGGGDRRPSQIQLITQGSCDVQECLDLLHEVEEEREKAMDRCSSSAIEELQHAMRQELLPHPPAFHAAPSHSRSRTMSSSSSSSSMPSASLASIQTIVDRDSKIYIELWQRHWDLLAETVLVLQHALEVQGDDACDVVLAYYQWRSRRPPPPPPREDTTKSRRVAATPTTTEPAWKVSADQALNKRDIEAGVRPGHFWGSSSSLSLTTPAGSATTLERPLDMDSDIIEELASPEQSLFIQLFVSHNRGLGWNHTNTSRPDADSSEAVYEAYATEAHVKVVPRSEYFDRDLTNQEHAQHVQTLLVRVAEKKTTTTTSPPAATVVPSSHPPQKEEEQQQQHSREHTPPHPMVTPTPVTTMPLLSRSRTTLKHPCPTEDDEDFPPPRKVMKSHRRTKGNHNKVTDDSRRTSSSDSDSNINSALIDIVSTPKQRMGRILSKTNNKRVISSEHTATASKRIKQVPVVSAIKASPKTVERRSPPNRWIGTSTVTTTSTVQRVPVTTTDEPNKTKRGRGRPRKYPKNDDTMSTTKKSDTPMSSFVAEKVVTWSPIITAPPGTPASCTRSVENRRQLMIFQDEADELGWGGHDSMSDFAEMNRSRAPRRCLRCVQFGGRMALVCKGRGGQKNCVYFNSKGKHAAEN